LVIDNHVKEINKQILPLKKNLGIYFTPKWIVDFMVSLINKKKNVKILEPACGVCQFLHAIDFALKKVGVEISENIISYMIDNGLNKGIEIIHADYLLWSTDEKFDVIIANPPYGIPSLSSHYSLKVDNKTKKQYKKLFETWYGKYNLYGAFIEKSVKLLKDNGELIFIVPATFMILDEFKKLRKFLSYNGKTEIIYVGQVFKPEASVTAVVLKFTKSIERNRLVVYDYINSKIKVLFENQCWKGEKILFYTEFTNLIDKICSFKIGDIYEIKISPRTPEIKNNKNIIKNYEKGFLPILNGKNLKIGYIDYNSISGYWIKPEDKITLKKFFDIPHIVVGLGFRKGGQIGAAYDYKAYPWMGEVYHLLKKDSILSNNFDLCENEVVEFLNSEIMKKYIRDSFRDITYHFNITQLKSLPLPSKEDLKILKNKGLL